MPQIWQWYKMGVALFEVTACQTAQNLNISLSFGILFRLLHFKLYSNICVINITNTYQFVYFSQTNLLLYLSYWSFVKEISKSRDHIIIRGKQAQAAQRKSLSHLPWWTNLGPWDFRCPASNIALRPTPDPKLVTPLSLQNHPTPPPLKKWRESFEQQPNCLFEITSPASSIIVHLHSHWMCSHHHSRAHCLAVHGGILEQLGVGDSSIRQNLINHWQTSWFDLWSP